MNVVQIVINGLLLGGAYALLGMGMTIIFGIIKLTNLAHGEFIVLGAYASVVISSALGVDPFLTLIVSVPLMFVFGFVLQYFLIGKAMKKGPDAALLVTFGLSIILKDAMLLYFSADTQHISTSYSLDNIKLFAGLEVPLLDTILFGISLVLVLILSGFLYKTHMGRAIRATADDAETASLCGVNIRKIYALAMGLSLACAAVAGLCVGMKWTFIPSSGGNYLLFSFVVVVIGGMGSIPGTLAAGIVFGMAQVVGGANYGLLISYALVILLLVLKPKGIVGK